MVKAGALLTSAVSAELNMDRKKMVFLYIEEESANIKKDFVLKSRKKKKKEQLKIKLQK